MSFAKNIGKEIPKNISKNLSGKYSQKHLDHAKKSATDAFATPSKIAIQKKAEVTGDLIGNKIVDRITKVSKTSPQNNSETQTEILKKKKRYVSPEEIQKIINDLRLI